MLDSRYCDFILLLSICYTILQVVFFWERFKLMDFNIKGMLTESDEKLVVLAATNRPQVNIILTRTKMSISRTAKTAPRVK